MGEPRAPRALSKAALKERMESRRFWTGTIIALVGLVLTLIATVAALQERKPSVVIVPVPAGNRAPDAEFETMPGETESREKWQDEFASRGPRRPGATPTVSPVGKPVEAAISLSAGPRGLTALLSVLAVLLAILIGALIYWRTRNRRRGPGES